MKRILLLTSLFVGCAMAALGQVSNPDISVSTGFNNWVTTTPTPTCLTGTATTISSTMNTQTVSKTTFINFTITVTTNGTCGGGLSIPSPVTAAAETVLICREHSINGNAGTATIAPGGTTFSIVNYVNSAFTATNNQIVTCSGVVQNQ